MPLPSVARPPSSGVRPSPSPAPARRAPPPGRRPARSSAQPLRGTLPSAALRPCRPRYSRRTASSSARPPASTGISCAEPRCCILEVNEVRSLLGTLTEEMPSFLSDATIRRFLRARNWSTEQATKGLKETVKWRREYRPDAISWEDIAEMEDEARRTHVGDYLDKNGRSVLVTNVPMKSKVSWKEQIKHLVYVLEYLAMNSADEQDDYVVWLTDFRGWSISNTPFSTTRESMHIIQNYYPGLIAIAVAFDPPRIFESFWKIAKSFVQPDMKAKLKFVYASKPESMKILADLFDLDTLESSFGGRSTSTAFDISKYAEKMRRADKMRGASKDVNGYHS